MKIGGFLKQSFIDYPGKISAVIFTSGCNFSCWYCHNNKLLDGKLVYEKSVDEIINFINERKNFLDAVVISGGEPTLHQDLENLIDKIKENGFLVKLDTNGSNPAMLKKLLPKLDYVAMDVKTSLSKYESVVGKCDVKNIAQSIEILKNSKTAHEFRTTFIPSVTLEDIEKIAKLLQGENYFYLQAYNPQTDDKTINSKEIFEKALDILKKYIKNVNLR